MPGRCRGGAIAGPARAGTGGNRGSVARPGDEIDNDLGELRAVVFLQEMAGAGQCDVRLVLGAGNMSLEEAVRPARDRVGVAEDGEEGLVPAGERVPSAPVGR